MILPRLTTVPSGSFASSQRGRLPRKTLTQSDPAFRDRVTNHIERETATLKRLLCETNDRISILLDLFTPHDCAHYNSGAGRPNRRRTNSEAWNFICRGTGPWPLPAVSIPVPAACFSTYRHTAGLCAWLWTWALTVLCEDQSRHRSEL